MCKAEFLNLHKKCDFQEDTKIVLCGEKFKDVIGLDKRKNLQCQLFSYFEPVEKA